MGQGDKRERKWLALFIGVQVLLWMASGSIMSFLQIERVRSEHVISRTPELLSAASRRPAWLARREPVVAVTAKTLAGTPVIEIRRPGGRTSLHDQATGARLSPLPKQVAAKIGRRAWTGTAADIADLSFVTEPVGTEFRGPFPAWQVQFADADNTRLYVDASNGDILVARSDTWRLFDFFWGLHIMDWTERDRINSWWLFAFGLGGVLVVLTGFVLLANRFPRFR